MRHVQRPAKVHIEGMFSVLLTSGYIRVGSSEYDPIWSSALENIRDLLRITYVGVSGAQPVDIVIDPFAHERFAEQTTCAEDGHSHAAVL